MTMTLSLHVPHPARFGRSAERTLDPDASRLAHVIRSSDDAEALLFDLILALRQEWKPSFSEAIAGSMGEAGLTDSLTRLRDAALEELWRIN